MIFSFPKSTFIGLTAIARESSLTPNYPKILYPQVKTFPSHVKSAKNKSPQQTFTTGILKVTSKGNEGISSILSVSSYLNFICFESSSIGRVVIPD